MFSPLRVYCAVIVTILAAIMVVPTLPQVRLNIARTTCNAEARAAAQRLELYSQAKFETCVAEHLAEHA